MKQNLLNKILLGSLFLVGIAFIPAHDVSADTVIGAYGTITTTVVTTSPYPDDPDSPYFKCGSSGPGITINYDIDITNPYINERSFNLYYYRLTDTTDNRTFIIKNAKVAPSTQGGSYSTIGTYKYYIPINAYSLDTNDMSYYSGDVLGYKYNYFDVRAILTNGDFDSERDNSNYTGNKYSYLIEHCSDWRFLDNYLILEPHYSYAISNMSGGTTAKDSFKQFLSNKGVSSEEIQSNYSYSSPGNLPIDRTCYVPLGENTCYIRYDYGVLHREDGIENTLVINGEETTIVGAGDHKKSSESFSPAIPISVMDYGSTVEIGIMHGSSLLDRLNGVGPIYSTAPRNPLKVNLACQGDGTHDGYFSVSQGGKCVRFPSEMCTASNQHFDVYEEKCACNDGTVLKNGSCVLPEDSCDAGTVWNGRSCVLPAQLPKVTLSLVDLTTGTPIPTSVGSFIRKVQGVFSPSSGLRNTTPVKSSSSVWIHWDASGLDINTLRCTMPNGTTISNQRSGDYRVDPNSTTTYSVTCKD